MVSKYILPKFRREEDGAVTVDWVVLTASIVGLAAAGALTTINGVQTAATTVSTAVATKKVE